MPRRFLSLALVTAIGIAGAGCTSRSTDATIAEQEQEVARLTEEINRLSEQNKLLVQQRDTARDEILRLREHNAGISNQLKDFFDQGSLGDNWTSTGRGVAFGSDYGFETGSDQLKPEVLKGIRELARQLNQPDKSDTVIIVEGHTDSTPVKRRSTVEKFGDNWGLSAMRAASVIRALVDAGVNPERIHGSFRGQYSPISKKKAENRRVEIFLSLPADDVQ